MIYDEKRLLWETIEEGKLKTKVEKPCNTSKSDLSWKSIPATKTSYL